MKKILFLFIIILFCSFCRGTEVREKPKERVFEGKCYVYLTDKELSRIYFMIFHERAYWSEDSVQISSGVQDIVSGHDFIYQVDDCSVKKYSRSIQKDGKPPLLPIYTLLMLRKRNEILRYIKKIYVRSAEGKKKVIDTSLLPDNEYAFPEK